MKISNNGIEFIKNEEGLVLKAYKCPAGVWTIGYGHTLGVKPTDMVSESEAEMYLRTDLRIYELAVNNNVEVDINQNQYDALVSFCFNVGVHGFKKSTLLKKINAKASNEEIAEEFRRWNRGGGVVLPVLKARREREIKLYMS